jgi:hypothetical protein
MAMLVRKVVLREHITGANAGQYSAVLQYELGPEHEHFAGMDCEREIVTHSDIKLVGKTAQVLVDIHGCGFAREKL